MECRESLRYNKKVAFSVKRTLDNIISSFRLFRLCLVVHIIVYVKKVTAMETEVVKFLKSVLRFRCDGDSYRGNENKET